jgi:hypothetical protein
MKPLIAATVIVELASLFARTLALVGFAVILKSTPVTEIVVEDDTEPAVPTIVISAFPVCDPAVTVRVAFAFPFTLRLTLPGLKLVTKPHAHPLAVALRFTWPLKAPRLVTVIVLLTEPPAGIVSEVGLAERENPCTCTVTVAWH